METRQIQVVYPFLREIPLLDPILPCADAFLSAQNPWPFSGFAFARRLIRPRLMNKDRFDSPMPLNPYKKIWSYGPEKLSGIHSQIQDRDDLFKNWTEPNDMIGTKQIFLLLLVSVLKS